jgi:HSP20 family protein
MRRRRWSLFRDFFGNPEELFKGIDRLLEDKPEKLVPNARKNFVREKKTEKGIEKEYGPFVYGYSVTVGPDGKPVVREFGNIKLGLGPAGRPSLKLKEEREPLVDVIDEGEKIRVVVELPGVKKEDINLNCTEERLAIRVETEKRSYFKEVELPAKVQVDSAKGSYTNGILEVYLDKVTLPPKARRSIKVE